MPGPLYKPVDGGVVIRLADPDVATTLGTERLSKHSLIVERCDVLAPSTNVGDIRIGSEMAKGESTEARGEQLKPGRRKTLPRTDLSWWWVTGDTADDVVTWAAEVEVDRDGARVDV